MARIVDRGIALRDLHLVLSLTGLMLQVTAGGAVCAVARNILSSIASTSFGADLRSGLFRTIQTYSFTSIDRFEIGSLITRLTNDVNQVQGFFHGLMRIFAKAPIMAVGSIVMAVLLNPRMSLVLVAAVPVLALIMAINIRMGYPLFLKVQAALDGVNGVMQEYLAGVRVIKAFNRFDYEIGRFAVANQGLAATTTQAMRVMAFFGPGVGLTMNMGIIAVLWFGGLSVNHGAMHVGQIIAFTNYMTHVLFSLMVVSMVITMLPAPGHRPSASARCWTRNRPCPLPPSPGACRREIAV